MGLVGVLGGGWGRGAGRESVLSSSRLTTRAVEGVLEGLGGGGWGEGVAVAGGEEGRCAEGGPPVGRGRVGASVVVEGS